VKPCAEGVIPSPDAYRDEGNKGKRRVSPIEHRLIHIGGFMAISKELLHILACPKCKGNVHLNEKEDGIICDSCKLMYPIREDIPIMLIDEAIPID